MATNLFRGSCTPNLGGVQDYYTKDEINQLFRKRTGSDSLFLETNHIWVGNLSNVQSQYRLDPNHYIVDHATGSVANLSTERDIEESKLIRRNATVSIGVPGTVPFGVGPIIPPGMSLVGIGPDSYNVIDTRSGSVC